MVRLLDAALIGAAAFATAVSAIDAIVPECGTPALGKCPSHKPCCSQYGQCGVGAFCLGGCDPKFSLTKDHCVAHAVCQSGKYTFSDKNVVSKYKYLGDASKHDFVVEGGVAFKDDAIYLTMSPNTAGAVLSSTRYVWYGRISATLKTSRGAGVVSSFITMSDMKDEIDFEWVGKRLDTTETNYYWQGVPDYTHGDKHTSTDTYADFHTYTIDWKPESVSWEIDGKVVRTVTKASTLNETTGVYHFPQTPSRVQLSLWPGGLASNSPYTIEWAGGEIDWVNHPDIKANGYYYTTIKSVEIECYDPPSGAKKEGTKSYTYSNDRGLEKDVVIGNTETVLKSFIGTGMNLTAIEATAEQAGVETIPGVIGAGLAADERTAAAEMTNGASLVEGTSGGFEQNANSATVIRAAQGSILAGLVAFAALMSM